MSPTAFYVLAGFVGFGDGWHTDPLTLYLLGVSSATEDTTLFLAFIDVTGKTRYRHWYGYLWVDRSVYQQYAQCDCLIGGILLSGNCVAMAVNEKK